MTGNEDRESANTTINAPIDHETLLRERVCACVCLCVCVREGVFCVFSYVYIVDADRNLVNLNDLYICTNKHESNKYTSKYIANYTAWVVSISCVFLFILNV